MPAFSLLTPMPGLPWYLLPLWPLIFWRIQRRRKPGPRATQAGLEALGPGFRREERECGVIPDT